MKKLFEQYLQIKGYNINNVPKKNHCLWYNVVNKINEEEIMKIAEALIKRGTLKSDTESLKKRM